MSIDEFQGQYRWLSNFWPCEVVIGTTRYESAEHAYQSLKTFKVSGQRIIASSRTPGQAKRDSHRFPLRPDWNRLKVPIMKMIVQNKFFQNGDLAERLLDTGYVELIEGNNWGDTFWGVCKGRRQNNLGKVLMEVREELRKGERKSHE